jgi:MoaA/NifB/PqqE/SkfB family radical SAM enzyme
VEEKLKLAKARSQGVIIGGGEPFYSKDLLKVISNIRALGLSAIIETNGYFLGFTKYGNQISSLLSGSNIHFDILIEGYNADMHDFLVGKKSFQVVNKAFKNLSECGLNFITHSVILKSNYRYLKEIATFISHSGSRYHRFIFPMPLGRAKENFDSVIPFASMTIEFIELAADVFSKRGIGFHVEGLPLCFFQSGIQSQLNISSLSHDLKIEHSEQCKACRFNEGCSGFFQWYFNEKSTDDLFPVK